MTAWSFSPSKHDGTTARFVRAIALCLLFLFVLSRSAAALEGGTGSYVYTDGETGKTITVWYAKPAEFSPDSPVVMVLHGVNRNARNYRDVWQKYADEYGFTILAPEFSKNLFPGNHYAYGNYFAVEPADAKKNKTSPQINPRTLWTFSLPDRIFEEYREHREQSSQHSYYVYGHSAGAQFIHRMMLFVPNARVKMAIAANAGWYTLPDTKGGWPYGLKETSVSEGDISKYLTLPLVVLLGENDTDSNHPELRRTKRVDVQGTNRLQRGRYFFEYGARLAQSKGARFGWKIHFVPGAEHSNRQMAGTAAGLIANDAAVKRR